MTLGHHEESRGDLDRPQGQHEGRENEGRRNHSPPRPIITATLRRALIDTALELVTEEQDWAFSLREVARRAGVSHQAPYNHFPEKQDLLAAVAVVGFERLRDGMLRAMAGIDDPEALVAVIGRTYVRLGLENPALYRLMFGSALADVGPGDRPMIARSAGAGARAVLEDVIQRGARSGAFCRPGRQPKGSDPRRPRVLVRRAWPDHAGDRRPHGAGRDRRRRDREAAAHGDQRSANALSPAVNEQKIAQLVRQNQKSVLYVRLLAWPGLVLFGWIRPPSRTRDPPSRFT